MKSAEYWRKRSEQIAKRQYDKADQYEADLRREYDRAMQSIRRDIEVFYQRFAINNEISMAEARQLLSGNELKEFKMTLSEFRSKAKNNEDGRWTQELNNVYYKTRISRFEALLVQIKHQVEMLAENRQRGAQKLLGDIYEDTYYRTLFEIQKGNGLGISFAKVNAEGLETVLSTEFAGSNWSKRIWGDRDKLINELRTKLSQSFIRGDKVDKTVKDLMERMSVSRSNAERLVQTESAFFAGQATMAGYKASGIIRQYEILATLDGRTSQVCRGMDGRVFNLNEMQVGVNYPPFHTRCRTTVVPYFEDEINVGERIAKDEEGKTYYVRGDITYPEWKKNYVDESGLLMEPEGGFNRKYNPKASYYADLPGVSESVLEKVADFNRSIARQGYKESREIAVVLDSITGDELGRTTGTIDKVKFSQEMHKALLEAPANSVIVTHNHPRGTRINIKDIINLGKYPSISHLIAVGHDGGVSFVSTNGNTVDQIMLKEIMLQVARKVDADLQKSKQYGTMSITAKEEYWDNTVLKEIAKELGWTYVEEFEGARKQDRRF